MSQLGSFATEMDVPRWVRFYPHSDHMRAFANLLFGGRFPMLSYESPWFNLQAQRYFLRNAWSKTDRIRTEPALTGNQKSRE
jgi:hypothetical protein